MKTGEKIKNIALDGVIRQNPTFKLVLGVCPTLALTSSAMSSLGIGIAVMFVLVCSNVIISLLRNIIPDKVRIPCFIVIIATFVTILRMVMFAHLPELYDMLGVFLPLIVVNCIILGRAEGFASHNKVGYAALDGLFMGIGFTLALTLMGIVREVLGNGSIFDADLWDFKIAFFATPAGAFMTYGLFIAIFTLCTNAVEKKSRAKKVKATGELETVETEEVTETEQQVVAEQSQNSPLMQGEHPTKLGEGLGQKLQPTTKTAKEDNK